VIADAKGLAKLDKEIESLRTEKKSIAGELGEIGSRTAALLCSSKLCDLRLTLHSMPRHLVTEQCSHKRGGRC
jgi:hypothetical protein